MICCCTLGHKLHIKILNYGCLCHTRLWNRAEKTFILAYVLLWDIAFLQCTINTNKCKLRQNLCTKYNVKCKLWVSCCIKYLAPTSFGIPAKSVGMNMWLHFPLHARSPCGRGQEQSHSDASDMYVRSLCFRSSALTCSCGGWDEKIG
jgi:hypothetical protein